MVATPVRELFAPFSPDFWAPAANLGESLVRAWDKVCADTLASGDAEPLHTTRDTYRAGLSAALATLDGYQSIADGSDDSDAAERIGRSREQLLRHYDSLFPRWQTLDDLEGILLERITPTREELKELAKRYPPPQAWYDDDVNPFEPEESR
jgi:hypothetical protein